MESCILIWLGFTGFLCVYLWFCVIMIGWKMHKSFRYFLSLFRVYCFHVISDRFRAWKHDHFGEKSKTLGILSVHSTQWHVRKETVVSEKMRTREFVAKCRMYKGRKKWKLMILFLYDPLFFGIFYSTFSLSIICRSSKTDQVKPKVRFKGGFSACFLFRVYNIYLQKLKILCSWQFKGCFSSVSF